MSEINIKVSQMEGRVPVTVLHVSGDIDAHTHQELDNRAVDLVNAGATHILLDLSENSYMSSAGFRSMHKIYTALQAANDESASLKLLNPSDDVKRLMKAMGFDTHFASYNDLSDAVKAF